MWISLVRVKMVFSDTCTAPQTHRQVKPTGTVMRWMEFGCSLESHDNLLSVTQLNLSAYLDNYNNPCPARSLALPQPSSAWRLLRQLPARGDETSTSEIQQRNAPKWRLSSALLLIKPHPPRHSCTWGSWNSSFLPLAGTEDFPTSLFSAFIARC